MPSNGHEFTRRRLLGAAAGVGLAAVAGCSTRSPLEDSTERVLRLTTYREESPLHEQYVTSLNRTSSPVDDEAFAAAVEGERYTTQYRTPFGSRGRHPEFTRHDGTYYRLGSVVVGQETVTHPVLRIYEVGDPDDLDAVPDHVAQPKLPGPDQRAVQIAHMAARARDNEGGVPWGLVQRDGYVYRRESAIEASAILSSDGPTHVAYRDRIYEVRVARETFRESVYRAEVEPVAETPEEMESVLRARLVDAYVTPERLSSDARDVFRRAESDGYAETHPYSQKYEELLKALQAWPFLDGNVEKDAGVDDGTQLVAYGDEYYEFTLRFVTRQR